MADIKWLEGNRIQIAPPKRTKKITGTRFATILGLNPWSTAFEMWCAITKTYEKPFEDTIYTVAGKTIEPKQARYMEQSYGMDIVRPSDVWGEDYFNKTWGDFFPESKHLGGMWDYLMKGEDGKTIEAVLEMKTTKRAEDWQNDVPEYYALQAALYAYLYGVDDVIMVASFLDEKDYKDPAAYQPTASNTITVEFKVSERYPDFADNGTYDLRDYSFREHNWEDFLTMQTSFNHTVSRDVKCKRWEKFIKEVTQNDADKADFLQRALGYSMLGMSNEECMFILHGKTTRNGKSTLLNTIETMLGDYAKVAPVGMICRGDRQKDAEAASPTLAGLKGKRFVTMSESNEYGKLDEEKIKQLTGGEEISARALYQSAITFKPQFTLWLSCNDLPMVTDKSLFASERIKVVEFNRHFSPEEQDTHLKDELCEQSSMSGIFMWLVRGYIHYKERGLAMSGSLKSVVTKYERDNDLVLQFLENRCERVPEESSPTVIKAKDLYNAFKIWAKSEGAYILSARKFNSEMERHPEWFDRKSTSSGYATYCGLKLKEVL